MSKPQIIQQSEEIAKETVKNVATGVKNEANATIREGFAQMFGIPLPDATVSQMKQQDQAQTNAQIGQAEQQLNALKQNAQAKPQESSITAILRKNTGLSPEQAKQQLKQTLFGEAQRLGQTSGNVAEQQEAQRKQQNEDEELQIKQRDEQRLATPIGLPGSHTQSTPVSRPVANQRQSTGETLKKRDT